MIAALPIVFSRTDLLLMLPLRCISSIFHFAPPTSALLHSYSQTYLDLSSLLVIYLTNLSNKCRFGNPVRPNSASSSSLRVLTVNNSRNWSPRSTPLFPTYRYPAANCISCMISSITHRRQHSSSSRVGNSISIGFCNNNCCNWAVKAQL